VNLKENLMDSASRPMPAERPSRFAVPEGDLEAARVTQAEMVQEVSDPHRVPFGDAMTATGDCGADGDGDGD
jgi:hypothetical protein